MNIITKACKINYRPWSCVFDIFNFVASSSLGPNAQLPSNVNLANLDELVEIIEDILKDVAVVLIVLGTVMLVIVLLKLEEATKLKNV
jgi:hypothetical protein